MDEQRSHIHPSVPIDSSSLSSRASRGGASHASSAAGPRGEVGNVSEDVIFALTVGRRMVTVVEEMTVFDTSSEQLRTGGK